MSLTKTERDILDKMSFVKGGGYMRFADNQYRVEPADDGFLFIGLGGKGGKVLRELKAGVYKNFKFDKGKTHPDNMEFIVIDTDQNDLELLCSKNDGKMGLESTPENNEICQLYDRDAAGRLKPESRHTITKNITSWLNPNMGAKLTGMGAGGIRQASRYLLFSNGFSKVKIGLENKLSKLHDVVSNQQNAILDIFIFAGIGGGTGSGTIVDIPYIVREICERNGWRCKVSGYLMMPDTYDSRLVRQVPARWNNVRRNTYAALKEINYYMLLESLKGMDGFRYKYGDDFEIELSSTSNIFDSCFLVTGKTETDGSMSDPDKESRRVVSDTVMNLVKKSMITENEFLVTSFMDNNPEEINTTIDLHDEIPKGTGFVFNTIGYGTITLPLEQMLTYTANQMYQDFKTVWSVQVVQQDIESELEKFRLLPQKIYDDILRNSKKSMLETEDIDAPLKDEVTNGVYYSNIKNRWRNFNVDFIDEIEASANIVTSKLTEDIERELHNVLLDKGILYAMELLQGRICEDATVNGMITRVEREYIQSVHDFISTINNEREEYKIKRKRLEKNIPSIIGRKKWLEDYKEICINEMNCDTRIEVFDQAEKALIQIILHLRIKATELERYNEILEYLGEIIENNYNLARKKSIGDAYAVQLFDMSRDDERTLTFLHWLKKQVAAPNDEIRKARAEKLIRIILDTKEFWLESENAENFSPINILIEFMENEFTFLKEMTLEKFAEIYFGPDKIAEGIESIFHILMAKGALMAKPHITFSHWKTWVRHSYITVPNGAGSITNAIKSQASINGIAEAVSTDQNNISYVNMICGLPPYAFDDMNDYERVYEKVAETANGLHIIENETENLINLPPLLVKSCWNFLGISNIREARFLQNYEETVKNYLSIGIIWETINGYYSYYIPNDSEIKMEEIEEWCHNIYLQQHKKPSIEEFRQEFNKNFLDENRNLKSILINIDIFSLKNPNSEQGLQEFMRYYITLTKNLEPLYKCFVNCKKMIEESVQSEDEEQKLMKAAERYYQYTYLGILQQREHDDYGKIIVLTDEKGEEFILCYEEDYNNSEKQIMIYKICLELCKCDQDKTDHESGINAEFLVKLDELVAVKKKDRSGMVSRRTQKDIFVKQWEAENKAVLSLDMKKYLGSELERVKNVYERLHLLI